MVQIARLCEKTRLEFFFANSTHFHFFSCETETSKFKWETEMFSFGKDFQNYKKLNLQIGTCTVRLLSVENNQNGETAF